MPEAPTVRRLDDVGSADVVLVGGKGANLGELITAGFRVPPGFVVTTEVHARSDEGAVPAPAREEIAAAYAQLGSPAVAVRSSAIAEDSPEASFAGQYESFLDVRGEADVIEAIARCWSSLFAERAVRYGRERGLDEALRIAVVVQEMAPHEAAGVVFTVRRWSAARSCRTRGWRAARTGRS